MKRVAICIIALLLAYNGALAADEAVFVEKGSARSVREIGSKWTSREGSLVCGGTGNFLVAGKAVGAGDFQVRARLSLERLDGTAASLMIGGKAMVLARSCEGHLWEIRSDDDGRTWSEPKPTALVHPDAPPMLFHHPDGKTLVAFHHNSASGSHFMHSDRSEIWVSLSADQGRTWSEPRFVFANALAPGRQSAWYNHQCSYMDAFADGNDLHLFVPHRWKRALHLHLKASDLNKLPTKAQLSIRQ